MSEAYRSTLDISFAHKAGLLIRQTHHWAANVFVAGGGMAGYDPTGIKARGGMAIATGYRAAQEAMAA